MPFARPTLPQIAARVKTDIQGAFAATSAFFRRSVERAAGNALTGESHHLHGHLAWIADQLDPRKAEDDIVEKVHGEPFGVFKKDGEQAKLVVSADGSADIVAPAGTVWVRADGQRYTSDEDIVFPNGGATLSLTAETAGTAANCDNGVELDIESPIVGLEGTATITATTTVGSDRESPEDYLERVLARRQTPPRGGATGDYVDWTLEVPGVTRAWEIPRKPRVGWVTVFAVNDNADPIELGSPKLDEIRSHLAARAPSTVDVLVATPTLLEIDVDVTLTPDNPTVRAAIEEQLAALYRRVGTPEGMTLYRSQMIEAISRATGEDHHTLVSPSSNVIIPYGSLPVLGELS